MDEFNASSIQSKNYTGCGRVTKIKIRKGKFVWVSGQEQENNHIHKFGKTRENVKLIGGKSLRLAFIYHLGMFYIDKQRP